MNGLIKKAGLGIALAATAVVAAAPADAQRYGYRGGYHGGYRHGGGDVAAGALLGGIVGLGLGAAIANDGRGRYYDRGYYDAPPPPPRAYYDGYGYNGGYGYNRGYGYGYARRCWTERRYDPYYGRSARVRVCN